MHSNPDSIHKQFITNKIDKKTAVDLLISYIENDLNDVNRLKGIKILQRIILKNNIVFEFFENVLISDTNEIVREHA